MEWYTYISTTLVWPTDLKQALIKWVTDEKRSFSIQQQEEAQSIIEAIHNTNLTENKLQYQKEFLEWVEGQIVKGTGMETEPELGEKAREEDALTKTEAEKIVRNILKNGYYPGDAYLENKQNVSDFFLGRLHDKKTEPADASRRANALTGKLLKRFSLTQPTSGQGMCEVMTTW